MIKLTTETASETGRRRFTSTASSFHVCKGKVTPVSSESNPPATSLERCPYLETQTVAAQTPKRAAPIHLSITFCHLSEEMKRRLETTAKAKHILDALTIRPHTGPPRLFCGPDMEPPVEPDCTRERLEGRCTRSFHELLTTFQIDASLPHESRRSEF